MASDKRNLTQLEDRLRDAGYVLRYERGHFRAGFCVVHERRVVVINKFFDPAARLQTLREIIADLQLDAEAVESDQLAKSDQVADSVQLAKNADASETDVAHGAKSLTEESTPAFELVETANSLASSVSQAQP